MSEKAGGMAIWMSIYSPMVIVTSMFVMSIFQGALQKGLFYIFWVAIATGVRMFIKWWWNGQSGTNESLGNMDGTMCGEGIFLPYQAVTYSTYVLMFTMMYMVLPLIMMSAQNQVEGVNYYVIAFMGVYIIYDLLVKVQMGCLTGIFTSGASTDLVGGASIGAFISMMIYYSPMKSWLFVNEMNGKKEVCGMKGSGKGNQQYKCAVYKNGTLVSG